MIIFENNLYRHLPYINARPFCKGSILETEVHQIDALIRVFANVRFTVFPPL